MANLFEFLNVLSYWPLYASIRTSFIDTSTKPFIIVQKLICESTAKVVRVINEKLEIK